MYIYNLLKLIIQLVLYLVNKCKPLKKNYYVLLRYLCIITQKNMK